MLRIKEDVVPPQAWFTYLDHDTRIRTRITTNRRGEVTVFTLQLELLVDDDWLPDIRYDTAHGQAHIDLIDPAGVADDKIWPGETRPFNTAFNRPGDASKESADEHRSRFLRQLGDG